MEASVGSGIRTAHCNSSDTTANGFQGAGNMRLRLPHYVRSRENVLSILLQPLEYILQLLVTPVLFELAKSGQQQEQNLCTLFMREVVDPRWRYCPIQAGIAELL